MLTYHKENLLSLAAKIEAAFGGKLLGKEEKTQYVQFSVTAQDAKPLIRFLKEEPDLGFTYFIDQCGVDYLKYPQAMPERFAVVTTLMSPKLGEAMGQSVIIDNRGGGGTIIGTRRGSPYDRADGPARVRQVCDELALDGMVVIGGNGSLSVAADLHRDIGLPVVGVPKTIDNDIVGTDICFGFSTAVATNERAESAK